MELIDLEESDGKDYRKTFDCGEPTLNDYLKRYARQQSRNDISQTHLLFDFEHKRIISYYSTCNYSIQREVLSTHSRFPTPVIPATLIGRLAVDSDYKGQGYGAYTLVEALKQIKTISAITGINIVIVDALNESAKEFYKNFGFIEFDDDKMRLFITIASISELC